MLGRRYNLDYRPHTRTHIRRFPHVRTRAPHDTFVIRESLRYRASVTVNTEARHMPYESTASCRGNFRFGLLHQQPTYTRMLGVYRFREASSPDRGKSPRFRHDGRNGSRPFVLLAPSFSSFDVASHARDTHGELLFTLAAPATTGTKSR